MSTRGLTSANNIVTVDGLMVNGLDGDGAVQQYFNQAMVQEMSYQTSGAGADVSPGGVRMDIVAQGRRQPVQRIVLRRLHDRGVAGQQPRRRHRARGLARRRRHRPDLRLQPRPSAARSSATSCGSSARARSGRWTRRLPTRFYTPEAPVLRSRLSRVPERRRQLRAGHRRPEHRERAAAPHLADEPEAQVLGLLRRDQQVPRSRHERRRRSAAPPRRSGPRRATTRRRRSTPAPAAASCWPRPATRSTTRSTSSPTRTA